MARKTKIMKKAALPFHPREATQKLLRSLPNRRLRDVIERRFGLRRGQTETLEAIGKSYGITRERVRQIEEDALRRLRNPASLNAAGPVLTALFRHLEDHGGVAEEKKLFHSVADQKLHTCVAFLLALAEGCNRKQEDDTYHHRWYTKQEALKLAESILEKTVSTIEDLKKPIPARELFTILRNNAKSALGVVPSPDTLDAYLSISRLIKQNPYGEFGLRGWATVSPSGVRDKAYAALAKAGKALHFREVALGIDKAGWGKKKAHPQTVHNELIKDNRFVLIGRGLYALKEWGYEPGTVLDVIQALLKDAHRALGKDEITRKVLEKRKVKENTILLNLQNRKRFKKTDGGYTLV